MNRTMESMKTHALMPISRSPAVRAGTLARALALLIAAVLPGMALAAGAPARSLANTVANVVVEAVQMPAWVEREGGQRDPVFPGMVVRPSDRLKTGEGSRLLLRTREGSTVKLGANASFRLGAAEQRPGNVFAASMQVLEGAFRFTTDSLAKYRGRREITIQVANVTAGIRGTDLWGKSAPNREIVCLIEGRIEVAPQNEAPLTLDQPLQFYVRENGRSQPLASVAPEQLKQWAAETEIEAGRGAMRRGGHWKVTLVTVDTQAAVLDAYDRVREAGYPATILPVKEGEKNVYVLRLTHLSTRAEAEALALSLKGRMGLDEPRVSR
jgi:hypothetical protein